MQAGRSRERGVPSGDAGPAIACGRSVSVSTTGRPAVATTGKAVASISAWGIAKADRATFGEIWQHHFSSRAQREGSARRIAGLPREYLDTVPGMRSERA